MDNELDVRIQHAVIGSTTTVNSRPKEGEIIFNSTLDNFRVGLPPSNNQNIAYNSLPNLIPHGFYSGTAVDEATDAIPTISNYKIKVGDYYLNTTNYHLWQCVSVATTSGTTRWSDLGTLKGTNGDDGSVWFNGNDIYGSGPVTATITGAKVGDYYLCDGTITTTTSSKGNVYECTATNTWTLITNIKGADGTAAGNTWRSVEVGGTQILDTSTSGGALNLVAGNNITLTPEQVSSDYTGKIEIAADNTDEKVKQSNMSSSTFYPLLVSAQNSPTSGAAYEARYSTKLTASQNSMVIYGSDNLSRMELTSSRPFRLQSRNNTSESWSDIDNRIIYSKGMISAPTGNSGDIKYLQATLGSNNAVTWGWGTPSGGGTSYKFKLNGSWTNHSDTTNGTNLSATGTSDIYEGIFAPISGGTSANQLLLSQSTNNAPVWTGFTFPSLGTTKTLKYVGGTGWTLADPSIYEISQLSNISSSSTGCLYLNGSGVWSIHDMTYRGIEVNGTTILGDVQSQYLNLVAGTGITLTPETSGGAVQYTGKVTISSSGGTSYSLAVEGVNGLLKVDKDASASVGYENTEDVIAIPIFYGTISKLRVFTKEERDRDTYTEGSEYTGHYVNVRDVVNGIIKDQRCLQILAAGLGIEPPKIEEE